MREVTKYAPQQAIKNLGTAFKNYFADLKKPKRQRRFRHPQFKKKGKHDSFRRARTAGAKSGLRKAMIVALARKLLIDLWRYVTIGKVPPGAVLRPAT